MKNKKILSIVVATTLCSINLSADSYTYSTQKGWNLVGAVDDITNFESFKANGTKIWVYNLVWSEIDLNSNNSKISKGQGFWFLSNTTNPIVISDSIPTENTSTNINSTTPTFRVVDTNQIKCFDSNGIESSCANSGQDGAYVNNAQSYTKNSDGTVTDNITGLVWQNTSDTNGDGVINVSDKMSYENAKTYCENLTLANKSDWRLPDIKTMYSLIDFSGKDVSGYNGNDTTSLTPFINTNYFNFGYGDTTAGERIIDAQWATTTKYVYTTMGGNDTMFGVNLADGRIKGYPTSAQGVSKLFYVQCVRESEDYGKNSFVNNGDKTISDNATGLMWQQDDSSQTLTWSEAISYCENLTLANYSDWRLANAKELQSIVDYTKSPDTTNSPAIDSSFFNSTSFTNENGKSDYGFYWSSTTHKTYTDNGQSAVYVSFGRALGYMNNSWLDVHGAGAQRSDPKTLSSNLDPSYQNVFTYNGGKAIAHGPQGDVIRGSNFARCVRSVN